MTTGNTEAPGFLVVRERAAKPRTRGFTHVLDKGLPVGSLESLVETAGAHIDFLKLGWGTGYVSKGVEAKVAICRQAGIHLTLGGTLLEIAVRQGRVEEYAGWLERLGISHVEVSNGVVGMTPSQKQALIRTLASRFTVISEVGSKRPEDPVVAPEWVAEMAGDLEAGAALVIAEGRESGTVGLYTPTGEVRAALVEAIVSAVPAEQVIFEAPRKDQQAWFTRRFDADVNLGNISPDEVLALETLRLGLRADTFELLPVAGVAGEDPQAGQDPLASLTLPAFLTVRCPGCSRQRMTVAFGTGDVQRAAACDRCATATELLAASAMPGACPCCL